ncbi:hypothetical protein [Thermococcus alcaliphilus]|uniref:hypothetical protein n=1 Tax=Thermococcus alcaliphilus TaxID=139207 RepID=UPI002091E373|nr:hypothetical protein [Thermococcus alcaliphilus]MCO6042113.1 hypothetical protein [Thermococcus alcaliphilus]
MIEYHIIMALNGALTILGIAYVTLIFNKLKGYVSEKKYVVFAPLLAGILISIGFLCIMRPTSAVERNIITILLLAGPGIMIYSFSTLGVLVPTKRFVVQFLLILSSLSLASRFSDTTAQIIYIGVLLALLVLVHSLLMLRILSPFLRYSLLLSSWLFVAYSWLRYFINKGSLGGTSFLIVLLYSSAVILWVYSAMGIYDYLRRWL